VKMLAINNLTFVPFDEHAYQIYASWFADAELARRISLPSKEWLALVTCKPSSRAWLIYEGSLPVGEIQMDIEPKANIAYVVNPALRGQGYGKGILRAFLAREDVKGFPQIEAFVEPDNVASIHVLLAVGFVQLREVPDEDGCLKFVYTNAVSAITFPRDKGESLGGN
jgi:RimJ/RimL family protein N-acetyltransferase